MEVTREQIIEAVKEVGGDFDTWTKIHPVSAVWEAIMIGALKGIQNEHTEFLRTIYLSDFDFTKVMKDGKAVITKYFDVGLEYVDKADTNYSFHRIIKVLKKEN